MMNSYLDTRESSLNFMQSTTSNPEDAMARSDAVEWRKAIATELLNLKGAWSLVSRSEAGKKPIFKPRELYSYKFHPDGSFDKRKFRITIAALTKRLIEGVDYETKYAATPLWTTTRILLAVANQFNWDLVASDFKAFFLAAELPEGEEAYMEQPEVCNDHSGRICKLKRNLYGLPLLLQMLAGSWSKFWVKVVTTTSILMVHCSRRKLEKNSNFLVRFMLMIALVLARLPTSSKHSPS